MKTTLTAILVALVALTLGACSGNSDETPNKETPGEARTQNQAPDAEKAKQKAYTAAKIAEDKVRTLFGKATLEDGTPILDPVTGTAEKAKSLLANYFDPALADAIVAHYVTDKKSGESTLVNAEPFFAASILATKSAEDVQIDGENDTYAVTTADGGVYTLKWDGAKSKYIVTGYEKK
ncbi:hypothetical protein [Paenibacillus methanolicus]|uniref:Lipoprotein n=1 Tax=Paenibacillus methanolicus TaxID=582686 RepID=A0A5S5BRE3_9BACL|nr:hypothetical protein [Paenibacillus methanolicus]TYP69557.1 hypothetical protein BCM02_11473 [Paenibacillus methanolicus]